MGKVQNMQLDSIMKIVAYCVRERYTICYLGSTMLLGAYCVG